MKLILFILLGFVVCSQALTAPPPFEVVKMFYDPQFEFDLGGLFGSGIPGQMWYDETHYKSWKNQFSIQLLPTLNIWDNITFLQSPSTFYYGSDGICRPFGNQSFNSLFDWIVYATYTGVVTLSDGRVTDQWVLDTHNGPLIFNALHSNNSIPVRFIFPTVPITSTSLVNYTFLFSDSLVPGPFEDPEQVFEVPNSCLGDGIVCPTSDPVVDMDFYLFHEPNDFSLVNTNVADVAGDTFFVCLAVASGDFSYFQWLSWWQISTNTSWGQYQFCNFGSCFGGSETLVGREAAEGMGVQGGQCTSGPGTTNDVIGSWFSLPADGLCAEGATVGTNNCTWQINGRMKTINGSCLFSNGFEQACINTFKTGNLTGPQQLFLQAFASDDPSQGGCPPLPGPEFSSTNFSKSVRKNSKSSNPLLATSSRISPLLLNLASTVSALKQSL